MRKKSLVVLKEHAKKRVRNIKNVAGVGISKSSAGDLMVRVNVNENISSNDLHKIPKEIDSVPTEIIRVKSINFE